MLNAYKNYHNAFKFVKFIMHNYVNFLSLYCEIGILMTSQLLHSYMLTKLWNTF